MLVLDYLDQGHCLPIFIVVHLAYGSLFCKWPRLLCQSIVLLHENARRHTPNWTTAVYGCTSDRLWIRPNFALSVLSLTASLRSTWLVIAIDADVKQVITSWLPTLDYSVFTLEYEALVLLWGKCRDGSCDYVAV